jgi:GGDEF domain-containing protein
LRDSSNNAYVQEQISVARRGGGFVRYGFRFPDSKSDRSKLSYVKAAPGFDAYVGAGVFVDDLEREFWTKTEFFLGVVLSIILLTVMLSGREEIATVMVISLEGLVRIGEHHGRAALNEAVRAVAERLDEYRDEMTFVARLGEQWFAAITNQGEPSRPAASLCQRLSQPIRWSSLNLHVSASVGLASSRDVAGSAERLLQAAFTADHHCRPLHARPAGANRTGKHPRRAAADRRHRRGFEGRPAAQGPIGRRHVTGRRSFGPLA